MCHSRFVLLLTLVTFGLSFEHFRLDGRAQEADDARLLQGMGLPADTGRLLHFLRMRTYKEADRIVLEKLIKQLNGSYKERERASRELTLRGPAAVPFLKAAMKGAPLEVFRRAEQCIQKIESIGPEHPAAAVRLLVRRRERDAIPVLLNYLPQVEDEWLRDQVVAGLGELAVRGDTIDPLLVAELKSPVPRRREAAVYILACRAPRDLRDTVRRFLADPSPEVRLQAAQGLAGKRLWQNLRDNARGDEALLKSNRIGLGEPALLEFFHKRTLGPNDEERIRKLIRQLGAKAFYARAEASRQLLDYGIPALTFLKDAARAPDLEISRRAMKCVEEIQRGPGPALPAAASRLLAVERPADRSPTPAINALLGYVPFADDASVQDEVLNGLCLLSVRQPPVDPVLSAALRDAQPARRAAAAFVLGRVGAADQCLAVRKLLSDPDPMVRFRAAQGLLAAQDKQAVPVLIALLADGNSSLAWQAEETLRGIAGDETAPATTEVTSADRHKAVKDWQSWWESHAARIDLARASQGHAHLGLITICEYDSAPGQAGGRVSECGRDGKERWKITDLAGAMDAQVLPNGRVLVAENSLRRVTERDLAGVVRWEYKLQNNPVSCQRLPNGNTFIATYNQVLELTPARQVVYSHNNGPGVFIFSAHKYPNGQIVCMTSQGKILVIDARSGRELRTVIAGPQGGWASAELLPNGRYLAATMVDGQVREVDAAGKTHWQAFFPGAFRATRLPTGHTLVASMTTRKVAELDGAGKIRWEKVCAGRPWSVRYR